MSVVVRIEMPENCTCCPMCFTADVQGYHWCAALEQEVEEGLSRPKECPIICQLPEGHGRLVDAEKLKPSYVVSSTTTNSLIHLYVSMDDIKSSPTIVPEERSET